MAKALGIGGVFFKSKDPARLRAWYARWLGISDRESFGTVFEAVDVPSGGYTVWSPFPQETTYFAPSEQTYMINLMVDDLDEALSQVSDGGAEVVETIEELENGRFGWFFDPEGNKVELWEPRPTFQEKLAR
jgi:predicted enzyme related to lactoylglutathione lyase